MNKYIKIMLVVILLLALSVSVYFVFFKNNKQDKGMVNQDLNKSYNMPDSKVPENSQLIPVYKDFDPTQSSVIFKILEITKDKKLKVASVYPQTFKKDLVIELELNCKGDVYWVNTTNGAKEVYDTNNLFASTEQFPLGNLMVEGKCFDAECKQLVNDCNIYEGSN